MNIVSALMGLSIMGAAAPMIMQTSLAPFEAQKRMQNFGVAESAAVTSAANHEGAISLSNAPDGCEVNPLSGDAYNITCTEGEGRFEQTVTRAFRLMPESEDEGSYREFPYAMQTNLGAHQCPNIDPYGVEGWWRDTYQSALGKCIPQVAWTKTAYLNSNPDNWLWDINNIRGYGDHPDYRTD